MTLIDRVPDPIWPIWFGFVAILVLTQIPIKRRLLSREISRPETTESDKQELRRQFRKQLGALLALELFFLAFCGLTAFEAWGS